MRTQHFLFSYGLKPYVNAKQESINKLIADMETKLSNFLPPNAKFLVVPDYTSGRSYLEYVMTEAY